MSTPVPTNPNPFVDPNNALRQFNQYFGDLRKQYGEDAIRQVGFEPKEFQDLQASLRKLQLDPRATPEQHREAYMQARDTLARRLTTPLEATRSYSVVQQPKPAPSPPVANDGTMPLVTPMTVMSPDMKSPTQEQLYAYARAVGRGETGQWDPARGTFVMTAQPPQPQQGGLTQAQQPQPPVMPQPPEREVIGLRSPVPGVHGGDTRIFADQPMAQPHVIDNRIGPNFGKPMQPEGPQGLMAMGGLLSKFAEQFRNAESMPKTYTSAPRQLTQEEILGITSMPQRPQGVGMAPQMPQGMTLSNVPRQLTLSNVPMQGAAPQPVSAPQGMAMGGLLRKYYGGGMC